MENHVRKIREACELSLTDVAERLDLPEARLVRVELGAGSLRLDQAAALADILDTTLADLFPGLSGVIPDLPKRLSYDVVTDTPDLAVALREQGIDPDPGYHVLYLRMRGGTERAYNVSSMDKGRFLRNAQAVPDPPFFVFDSGASNVILNFSHLIQANLLWEPAPVRVDETEGVRIWYADRREPEQHSAEPDEYSYAFDGESGQLESIFFTVELSTEEPFLWFEDGDGELVVFNIHEVALFEAEASLVFVHDHSGAVEGT